MTTREPSGHIRSSDSFVGARLNGVLTVIVAVEERDSSSPFHVTDDATSLVRLVSVPPHRWEVSVGKKSILSYDGIAPISRAQSGEESVKGAVVALQGETGQRKRPAASSGIITAGNLTGIITSNRRSAALVPRNRSKWPQVATGAAGQMPLNLQKAAQGQPS
ncbi:hypothetical protein AGABI1DRAFT_95032 [Agaricus bisporus var. burnettii JB137-S8]|uniref:Uncharacterized protein n=1 Tax=Agaricus bisporus var. burnettii (strain JB137-S8 / ATCC MYA-4627 / FGSC 10392) TaxID=597362 RepID=K5WXH5_AGABU|nr:uncharacterized protein AGABI1DRAFT_95032 [Agaricus bisporus var. burnettii JB137-S8]EKM75282.1 hypothetical protein AGABI1DRAFT_95032 [Agaricus bisporus var. burnettii JB137-S8]